MRKLSCVLALLVPMVAVAEESPNETKFNFNVRRIGLDWTKTDMKNSAEYQNSSVAALKASDQQNLKGIFDAALEYGFDRFKWDNSLFMEYGKQSITDVNGEKTVDESADKILLSSDLAYACWDFDSFKLGPIVRGQYETEFQGDPRRNVLRPNAGFALFDHDIIKSLYIVGVYEYDFTYADNKINKGAVEAGWRLEYQIRDGVKLSTNGYYREYLTYSAYEDTDLKRDFSATARMDTNLWNNFTMGPYVQYRIAKSRDTDVYGSNFMIGLSFNYIAKYDLLNYGTDAE